MPRRRFDSDLRPAALDEWARQQGYRRIVGVDEVGRGPLAGPVVAAAVILPDNHGIVGLADSKKLTARRREKLAVEICNKSGGWAFGLVGPRRIDEINIRRASLEAMARACRELLALGTEPDLVMVDGCDTFPWPEDLPGVEQRAFIKADTRSETVAAASIVAKVYRDALMQEYHALFPAYGFDRHKGYPTPAHKRAIRARGPCEIHRMTFRGVQN
jgi:ribonuclease HII